MRSCEAVPYNRLGLGCSAVVSVRATFLRHIVPTSTEELGETQNGYYPIYTWFSEVAFVVKDQTLLALAEIVQ